MSFTPTTVLAKQRHFAFLAHNKHSDGGAGEQFNFELFPKGVMDYLFNNSGAAPVSITADASVNHITTMACTYILSASIQNLTIENSFPSSALIVNNTGDGVNIKDYNDNLIYLLPDTESVFVVCGADYAYYSNFVPFGYCTDELSIKELKGDELNLSHVTGLVQSKI
jgi:hypothetical protein